MIGNQKFRIFEKLTNTDGKMHYSENTDTDKIFLAISLNGRPFYIDNNKSVIEYFNSSSINRAEIMFSTGCCDINNVEIYEADIVKFKIFDGYVDSYRYGVVAFGVNNIASYSFFCEQKFNKHIELEDNVFYEISCDFCKDCEVEIIGNIYEHQYLLEDIENAITENFNKNYIA